MLLLLGRLLTFPLTKVSSWVGSSSIPPISVADYDVPDAGTQDETPYFLKVVFEKEDLETTLELRTFHVRGRIFSLRSLSLYAPLPSALITSHGPSQLGPTFLSSSAWLASLLRHTRAGMPIYAGITASIPQVSENGVSPFLDLIMVRCSHRMCGISSIQSLLLLSNRAFIPSLKLLFALSSKPLTCGCLTEVKHWRIFNFSLEWVISKLLSIV
nr:hypothetical protein [Tanacetum cinerariifolium]